MNWTCPYCQMPQTITKPKRWSEFQYVDILEHSLGDVGAVVSALGCANEKCQQITVTFRLVKALCAGNSYFPARDEPDLFNRQILPDGTAKYQPEYIPSAIREDYREACLIRDLSPKASATLARRCLQGMIRDFTKIARSTLYQEITDLRKAVDDGSAPRNVSAESVAAIDHVRSIGNIGAHMETDVDHIVSVEPEEAQMLIELIETLFDEWYVERHVRAERFAALGALADAKKLARQSPPLALPAP